MTSASAAHVARATFSPVTDAHHRTTGHRPGLGRPTKAAGRSPPTLAVSSATQTLAMIRSLLTTSFERKSPWPASCAASNSLIRHARTRLLKPVAQRICAGPLAVSDCLSPVCPGVPASGV
jgi:hypothetical protein